MLKSPSRNPCPLEENKVPSADSRSLPAPNALLSPTSRKRGDIVAYYSQFEECFLAELEILKREHPTSSQTNLHPKDQNLLQAFLESADSFTSNSRHLASSEDLSTVCTKKIEQLEALVGSYKEAEGAEALGLVIPTAIKRIIAILQKKLSSIEREMQEAAPPPPLSPMAPPIAAALDAQQFSGPNIRETVEQMIAARFTAIIEDNKRAIDLISEQNKAQAAELARLKEQVAEQARETDAKILRVEEDVKRRVIETFKEGFLRLVERFPNLKKLGLLEKIIPQLMLGQEVPKQELDQFLAILPPDPGAAASGPQKLFFAAPPAQDTEEGDEQKLERIIGEARARCVQLLTKQLIAIRPKTPNLISCREDVAYYMLKLVVFFLIQKNTGSISSVLQEAQETIITALQERNLRSEYPTVATSIDSLISKNPERASEQTESRTYQREEVKSLAKLFGSGQFLEQDTSAQNYFSASYKKGTDQAASIIEDYVTRFKQKIVASYSLSAEHLSQRLTLTISN